VKTLLPFAALLLLTVPLFGHGARAIWELQGDSVHISASYDDGQPLSRAQITVFSGAAPSVPYMVGMTDENGEFSFLPDREESLDWDVQVRSAGHGDMVHLSLTEEPEAASEQGTFSTLQVVLMSACVVWGFVGTAFFFASRRKK